MARAEAGYIDFVGISKDFGFQSMLNRKPLKVFGHRSVCLTQIFLKVPLDHFAVLRIDCEDSWGGEQLLATVIIQARIDVGLHKGGGNRDGQVIGLLIYFEGRVHRIC